MSAFWTDQPREKQHRQLEAEREAVREFAMILLQLSVVLPAAAFLLYWALREPIRAYLGLVVMKGTAMIVSAVCGHLFKGYGE